MNQGRFRKFFNPRPWAYGLFWSWNIIFLAFMLLGFAPRMLPEMLNAVRIDQIPAAFLIYAVILTAIPVAVVMLGKASASDGGSWGKRTRRSAARCMPQWLPG